MPIVATSSKPTNREGYAGVLARTKARAKAQLDHHEASLEDPMAPARAQTWRGLVGMLGTLAPYDLQTVGRSAVQFFVADGRYRLQMFALEDGDGGALYLFLPNVLQQALTRQLIVKSIVQGCYADPGDPTTILPIELIDRTAAMAHADHVKFMVGLNRQVLRLTLRADGDFAQLRVARWMCELAASLNVPATSLPWARGQQARG